jgi:hypothetical protein
MTEADFRKLALELFMAEEGSHMGHADFRVGGRVFASLPPARREEPKVKLGMVRVPREFQRRLAASSPETYFPAAGAWGQQGCTYVRLAKARAAVVRGAMSEAWNHTAPARIRKMLDAAAKER